MFFVTDLVQESVGSRSIINQQIYFGQMLSALQSVFLNI